MNSEISLNRTPKHKGKGKGKENADCEFRSIRASVILAVPPIFANRLRDGVEEMLDTMTMRSAHAFPWSPCTDPCHVGTILH